MMTRRLIAVALATSLTGLAGCGKKENDSAKSGQQAKAAGEKAAAGKAAEVKAGEKAIAEGVAKAAGEIKGANEAIDAAKSATGTAAAMLKPGEAPSPETLEKLLVGLSACELTERGIDRKCEAWKSFDAARKASRSAAVKNLGGIYADLGRKHIKHEHPAVRLQAASMMGSIFGASKDSQGVLIEAAKTEQDPRVLREMIRAVGSSVGKNPAVKELLLATAGHKDDKVRIEVVSWLTSSWAGKTEGTLEKAMEIAEQDTSDDVKRFACKRLGERGDERALPLLKKMTDVKNPKVLEDDRMFSACFEGVIAMWSAPVPHKTPSEAAYKHTLALLTSKKARGDKNPPWTVFSRLRWAKKPKFQEAAGWYKGADVQKALSDIVMDRKTNWMARTGAVDTMKELGAEKAAFEKLAKAYEGAERQDAHVLKKIEKVLASL